MRGKALLLLVGCLAALAGASAPDDAPAEAKPKPAVAAAAAVKEPEDEAVAARDSGPWLKDTDYLYLVPLAVFSVLLLLLIQRQNQAKISAKATSEEFRRLRNEFLLGYGLCVAADWMQGPYVYKLYSYYGFTKGEIGFLFVVGFFSSMCFGTVAAGLADRFGRKRICLIYCLVYGLSCLTKHSTDYNLLLVGRLLAGISTSILHSGFESWYVAEHKREAFPEEWMIETLSLMSTIKGVVAIVAAIVSSVVASKLGFVAPFDAALVLLIFGGLFVNRSWKENYGDKSAPAGASFAHAWVVLAGNPKVWLLGFVQSAFEGAMYIFVFSWTPTLEATTEADLPHGFVFASFMLAIMCGSNGLPLLMQTLHTSEAVATLSSLVAAVALMLPGLTSSHNVILAAFCVFEACVGVFSPTIAGQRARHVPNEVRATMLAIFRIPLNLIVVLTLLNVSHLSTTKIAFYSFFLLLLAGAGERFLASFTGVGYTPVPSSPDKLERPEKLVQDSV